METYVSGATIGMTVLKQATRLTLPAPRRALTALRAAAAGTSALATRRFATGATATRPTGASTWASAFVAPLSKPFALLTNEFCFAKLATG